MPRDFQLQMGLTADLIRISVGLEDVGGLIAGLEQGFAACC